MLIIEFSGPNAASLLEKLDVGALIDGIASRTADKININYRYVPKSLPVVNLTNSGIMTHLRLPLREGLKLQNERCTAIVLI